MTANRSLLTCRKIAVLWLRQGKRPVGSHRISSAKASSVAARVRAADKPAPVQVPPSRSLSLAKVFADPSGQELEPDRQGLHYRVLAIGGGDVMVALLIICFLAGGILGLRFPVLNSRSRVVLICRLSPRDWRSERWRFLRSRTRRSRGLCVASDWLSGWWFPSCMLAHAHCWTAFSSLNVYGRIPPLGPPGSRQTLPPTERAR